MGTQKFGQPLDTSTLHFLQNFQWAFIRSGHVNISPNLKSVALPLPEIRGVAKLQNPNLEEGEAIGGRGWYYSKERWSVPISPPYILFLYQHLFARNCRLQFSVGVVNPR